MVDSLLITSSALALETIVERKGGNRLDRQVHQVIHYAPMDVVAGEAGGGGPEPHELAPQQDAPESESDATDIPDFLGFGW